MTPIRRRKFLGLLRLEAHHEAGHAIVVEAFGLRVWFLRLIHKHGGGAFGSTRFDRKFETREDWWHLLVGSLAGDAAEHRLTGTRPDNRPDDDQRSRSEVFLDHDQAVMYAWSWLNWDARQASVQWAKTAGELPDDIVILAPDAPREEDEPRLEATFEDAYQAAYGIICQQWPAVEAVAEALLRHGRLEGGQVRKMIRRAMSTEANK